MNNKPLYSDKYTVITPSKIDAIEGYKNFYGEYSKVLFDIEKHQLLNDQYFKGHLIINDLELVKSVNFKSIKNYKLNYNNIYTTKVTHDGVDSKCTVEDGILICSGWVLPFILNNYRTNNTLYGDLIAHRIKIINFNISVLI